MPILILAQQKFFPESGLRAMQGIWASFLEINQRGFISAGLVGLMVIAIASYLGLLVWTFQLGFSIDQEKGKIKEIREMHTVLELRLQEYERTIPIIYSTLFQSMEKISEIKYIGHENVAASHIGSPLSY